MEPQLYRAALLSNLYFIHTAMQTISDLDPYFPNKYSSLKESIYNSNFIVNYIKLSIFYISIFIYDVKNILRQTNLFL